MNESQLITACKKQSRSAQKALYELYAPKMMAICLRYCVDRDTANDLLHDGFVKIFTQINTFKGKGSFEGWMRRIFVNICIENYRKEKQKYSFIDSATDVESVEIEKENDDDSFEIENISREEILQLIKELPDGYRTVFNLFIFENMSHKDISIRLGITENASRSQYYRAKVSLQRKVQDVINKNKL